MKKTIILFAAIFIVLHSFAQSESSTVYLSTQESLANRKTPSWFNDAKLGIFIHWGLYSVPAWATPSTTPDKVTDWRAFYRNNPYAEWYLNTLRIDGSPTQAYHEKIYGKGFDYYNFADTLLSQTKNWNPASWAETFKKTGARYVVLTTKHHDGFTLYPSRVINPFMSKERINSSRDFVGELAVAVRKEGLKYGVYYSGGLDWTFNQSPITNLWPDLFQSMPKSVAYTVYADCQMHELIQRYKPDVLWNDVNYPKNGDVLGIFSELFNLNKNAVVNNRWEQYPELTDFTTPEYVVMDTINKHKWESCRGLGYSFGYNRVEGDVQLLSSEELIHLFVDVVSKNGNLLLNVGPKADGNIPENQLQRLTDLGDWMTINSEGIYDTHCWKMPSSKLKDGTEVRFTQKANDIYVFLLSNPKNNVIRLPFVKTNSKSKAILYGSNNKVLSIKITSDGLELQLPKNMDFKFASMIKVTNVE